MLVFMLKIGYTAVCSYYVIVLLLQTNRENRGIELLGQQHSEQLFRIDDLSHQSGVPSRTIRFYNTQEHLLVLNIIRELQEQQHLPLEIIKQLLEIRAEQGDIDMNLAFKQRLLRPLTGDTQNMPLSIEDVMQQTGASREQIDEWTRQELIFPVASAEN